MKILFVTYGGGHVNMLIPIIKKLQEKQEYNITVLGLTTAVQKLKEENIPFIGFKDFLEKGDDEAIEIGKSLVLETNSILSPEESIAYLGLSYKDLEYRLGKEEAATIYKEKGRQAFLPLSVMERVFNRVKPDLLISTNSPRAERAAFLTSRKFNIPSICIVDLFALLEVEWIGQKGFADKICILNEYVKQVFIKAGRNEEELVITGNPAFDRLADESLVEKAAEYRIHNNWGDKTIILWASQQEPGNPDLPRKIEEQLFNIISKYPNWQLVVRLHPNEKHEFHNLPDRVSISKIDDDLPTLISASDLIVTLTSTVGLEGALLNKPLVAVEMSVFSPDAPYADMGIAVGVSDMRSLESGILEALANKKNKGLLSFPKPGEATNNILNVIHKLLHECC